MNFLRAAFISLFILFLVLLSLYAGVQLWRNTTPRMSWFGLLLAAAAPLLFLAIARFSANRIEAIQPIGFSAFCGLGVAITMAANWQHGNAAGIAHIWAGACLIGWLAYLKWDRKGSTNSGT